MHFVGSMMTFLKTPNQNFCSNCTDTQSRVHTHTHRERHGEWSERDGDGERAKIENTHIKINRYKMSAQEWIIFWHCELLDSKYAICYHFSIYSCDLYISNHLKYWCLIWNEGMTRKTKCLQFKFYTKLYAWWWFLSFPLTIYFIDVAHHINRLLANEILAYSIIATSRDILYVTSNIYIINKSNTAQHNAFTMIEILLLAQKCNQQLHVFIAFCILWNVATNQMSYRKVKSKIVCHVFLTFITQMVWSSVFFSSSFFSPSWCNLKKKYQMIH